jgi:transposase
MADAAVNPSTKRSRRRRARLRNERESQRLRDEVSLEAMKRLAVRHLTEYADLFELVSVEVGLGEDDLL